MRLHCERLKTGEREPITRNDGRWLGFSLVRNSIETVLCILQK